MDRRYYLKRGEHPQVLFILLNPSNATDEINDATVRRLIASTRQQGYDAFSVVNLFTLRTPHPKDLKGMHNPVGDGNTDLVRRLAHTHAVVVYAWGNLSAYLKKAYRWTNREPDFLRTVVHPLCFRHTQSGAAGHPCRLHNNQLRWEPFRCELRWRSGPPAFEAWLQARKLPLVFYLVDDDIDRIDQRC